MADFDTAVQMYMSSPVYAVARDSTLAEARQKLDDWRVSAVAVVDGKALAGVVSRTDLLRVGRSEAQEGSHGVTLSLPSDKNVDSAMTTDVLRVSSTDTMRHAAELMVEASVHRVFVEGASGLIGVLSTRDIMDAIANERPTAELCDFMTSPITAIRAQESVATAVERLDAAGISGLVVLDEGWPVGVFTQEEALIARDLPESVQVEWAMNPAMLSLPHDTPLHRAAATASSMDVRRVIVTRGHLVEGVVTGLDFCRAVLALG